MKTVSDEGHEQQPSEALATLARACGVATDVHLIDGTHKRCSRGALVAILGAMGIDAHDDDACRASFEALKDYIWTRIVPPVTVLREGQSREIPVHLPHGSSVSVTLRTEAGVEHPLEQVDRVVEPHGVGSIAVGRATFRIPGDLPLGWHIVEATFPGRRGRGYVVVTPERLEVPEAITARRPWGFMTQLYSLRSSRSWGIGDLGDLADLCSLAKIRAGADFVLINPLHANEAVPPLSPSPYLPSSRRFLAPMYIRVEDIPEVAYVPSQQRAVIEWESERPSRNNNTDELLDRDEVWRAKRAALEQVFAAPRSPGREAQFEAFCMREGKALEDFATWAALSEEYNGVTSWPDELATASAAAVSAWRDEHPERVLFHAWLQWIADEQARHSQSTARGAGMSIGVVTDLAVGVHPSGADAWSLHKVLASGISVGAPPDGFNPQGQDWSQPPWQPRALEAAAYVPFRDVVRAAVRHSGAVRVDHILGLFRQWWIPVGHGSNDGSYVQFDHEALVGILILEAHRAGAIVIGEDLGTVEPWVRDYLSSRGVLGTSVLWFERTHDGGFTPPEDYRADALATVTTHDLPTTAMMVAGAHVDLRTELGLVSDPTAAVEQAADELRRLVALLRERDWVIEDYEEEDLIAGVHRMVMASPAVLTGVAITDAVGDMRAQNVPGTFEEYPNWSLPLTDRNGVPVLLDDLFDHPRMRRLIAAIRAARS
ncbi:4-alpha-glucanotransferase [Demequina sp. TTPB684]|uniref:4-alpha-glucanotransferase n=1 Tax=unclassified Demequina TaxID=2620311 RepID=UPI001CF144E1|nr:MULTISPECIES: 4-alpha-glucanotransferase [unclassified Demequina]MCB2411945.1 4-alpha-glucanotransferase [Demequina sp. TTPB684]UPU87146.1 4-alpha-glucanotransferase [Demequina sp. TMPB413]